jgi:thioredoxin reductase (NADPH)
VETDILVIGSGPAGMSAAQYSARAGWSTTIIDPMGPGGQLLYIDEIENYPGTEKLSGYVLSERMEKQCEAFGVKMEYTRALSIRKENNLFYTTADEGEIVSKAVIVATGAVHRKLEVKGEEEYRGKGVSYCATCDGPFFKGKKVIVAGGGDTALTDAIYLSSLAEEVVIVHRRNEFRAQKVLQDRVKATSNISLVLGDTITEILGDGKEVTGVKLQSGKEIAASGVFVFVGMSPSSDIVSGIAETDVGYIRTDSGNRTTLPGLFAAGDVTTTSFRQVVTAASDGARAAHSADEYIRAL